MKIYELKICYNPDRLDYRRIFATLDAATQYYSGLREQGHDISIARVIPHTANDSGIYEPDEENRIIL